MESLYIEKCENKNSIRVTVPGSKSITNRALMLAALSNGECVLKGALFSDDSRAFLDCLDRLGFKTEVDEQNYIVKVKGESGNIPRRKAEINVRSAGTAARFLTVMLAFAGGEYTLNSSEQMKKRPMEELITALRGVGVSITCLEEENRFPFIIRSEGVTAEIIQIDTKTSSQFASAILMSSVLVKNGLKIKLTGNRTEGSYVKITTDMMRQFNIAFEKNGSEYFVPCNNKFSVSEYSIEPDFSAACYFYAAGAILNREVMVNNLSYSSIQGDKNFLKVLEEMGCSLSGDKETVLKGCERLKGISVDMNDFSDQALTLAAIAPFADGVVEIKNISHIRKQECDRIRAMSVNLTNMGVKVEEGEDYIKIYPSKIKPCSVKTFNDHRVAMSFSLCGIKEGGVIIEDPYCCKKTFENYFEVLKSIY